MTVGCGRVIKTSWLAGGFSVLCMALPNLIAQ
jgi:hypothetical protein